MGELDVRILAELFGGPEVSKAITPAWDGGIYYAAQRRSAVTPQAKESTASLGLLYYSRWKSPAAAEAFMKIYAGYLVKKYSGVTRRDKDEAYAVEQIYSTNEGDVLLSISGSSVYVGEGFPLEQSRILRDRIAEAQASGPIRLAAAPRHDPAMELSRRIASFGMVKAALPQGYTLEQR